MSGPQASWDHPDIGFGGDYNPEQWPEETRAEDLVLMREAGVDLVSVGIFGWAQVEPRPGEYDFSYFDRVLDDLAGAGVGVSLATMTASPPPWLSRRHPEMLPQRADGVRLWPGGRQHYCPSSPVYREATAALVDRLAAHYAGHPALRLWHVNNEYGIHVSDCYCDVSAADFRRWLSARYEGVDALNEAWSTRFWSQHYSDIEEVLPPRTAPTFANPAQQLDFARFTSDALLACHRAEVEVLRRHTPDVPVTTNLCGLAKAIDGWSWAPHVDVVSLDSYPDPAQPDAHVDAALAYDVVRSLGGGRPWLLMEQAPSAVNWRSRNRPKAPGRMRLGSWQAVARGADAVMFFQWRQSRGGAEKFHSGMVPHAGPDSRTFREVSALGAELHRHAGLAGGAVPARAAVVLDWPSWWGVELDSHPTSDVEGLGEVRHWYAQLHALGITVDVVGSEHDLSGYSLVVAPQLYLTTEQAAESLIRYVRAGGHLVLGCFSGVVDEHDRVHPGGAPGPLRELVGADVAEWWPLEATDDVSVLWSGDGSLTGVRTLLEDLQPRGAEVVAALRDGPLRGRPAVLRHATGEGVTWYAGAGLDDAGTRHLLALAVEEADVRPVIAGLPFGVEAVQRHLDDALVTVLLNHGEHDVEVDLPAPMLDLADDRRVEGRIVLPAVAVMLLRPA